MDQLKTHPAFKAGEHNSSRMFVSMLVLRVLKKCKTLKKCGQEKCAGHAKRLIDLTMKGLDVPEEFCPKVKIMKRVCKVIMKDLRKKFHGQKQLETVILLEDPAVDKATVDILQAHVRKCLRLINTRAFDDYWSDVIQVLIFGATLLGAIFLLVLVP